MVGSCVGSRHTVPQTLLSRASSDPRGRQRGRPSRHRRPTLQVLAIATVSWVLAERTSVGHSYLFKDLPAIVNVFSYIDPPVHDRESLHRTFVFLDRELELYERTG